jgi:hypothetical protein
MALDLRTQKVVGMIQLFDPNYKLVYKSNSKLMAVLGWILGLVGAKTFMSSFWTTIGSTTYLPTDPVFLEQNWAVLFHEGKHVIQMRNYTLPFYFMLYLFPLTLFPVLIGLGIWMLWVNTVLAVGCFVLAALSLAPMPAFWRRDFELEGYTAEIVLYELIPGRKFPDPYIESYFTGPAYYFMWPFGLSTRLAQIHADVKDGIIYKDPYYKAVRDLILNEGWNK